VNHAITQHKRIVKEKTTIRKIHGGPEYRNSISLRGPLKRISVFIKTFRFEISSMITQYFLGTCAYFVYMFKRMVICLRVFVGGIITL